MEAHRYRQMTYTLALSLLVLCATNQFGGLVLDELGKLIAFFVVAALIFFVINRTSALRRVIASGLARFAGSLCTSIPCRRLIRRIVTVAAVPNELSLPCRFQRPPPVSFQ